MTLDELDTRPPADGGPRLSQWPSDTKLYIRIGGVIYDIVGIEHGPRFGSASIVGEPNIIESLASLDL